ncbi:hypothetical protein L208DRAFT_1260904 [Tricholoma matsutake]|nr:hypothetical protein L208DRAFT_1260904 [Tricholoma matsutake 945]
MFEEGLCLWDGNSSSPGYWDDQLTEDEMDIICGVYRVDTGQHEFGGRQTSDVSWWPKPSIWETSGLCVGYWSNDCERWFKMHLEECRSGHAELRNPSNWRHALKFTKNVV